MPYPSTGTFPGSALYPGLGTGTTSDLERLVLDPFGATPLDLQDGIYNLEEFDPGYPPRRPSWISGAESNGALLVGDAPYDDATGGCTVRIMPAVDGDMDAALEALGALTSKLQECSASGPDGLPVYWHPAQSSTGYTMYWKLAEYDGAPAITQVGDLAGWFLAKPIMKVKFTRDPALHGERVVGAAVTASTPILTLTVPDVEGDLAALGELIVTDGATQSRRHVEWGLEHRTASSLDLLVPSTSLVTTGFGGTATTRSGAYS